MVPLPLPLVGVVGRRQAERNRNVPVVSEAGEVRRRGVFSLLCVSDGNSAVSMSVSSSF